MAERLTRRQSTISDGLFYSLMSFVLIGAIGIGIGFAYGRFYGAGGWAGFMAFAIVAGIGGSILASAMTGKPLPPPNTVKIAPPPAPTAARTRRVEETKSATESAHDLGVSVGAALASVKERVQSVTGGSSDAHEHVEVERSTELPPTEGSVEPASTYELGEKPATLAAPREGGPDDLKRIKGIGPKLEEILHGLGIYHFDQIAALRPSELVWVDSHLEGFSGRATRDDWVGQARLLAAGGEPEHSRPMDQGEV